MKQEMHPGIIAAIIVVVVIVIGYFGWKSLSTKGSGMGASSSPYGAGHTVPPPNTHETRGGMMGGSSGGMRPSSGGAPSGSGGGYPGSGGSGG